MSNITQVILTCNEPGYDDESLRHRPIEFINAKIHEHYGSLVRVDDSVPGGNRAFPHDVWLACFNHLPYDEFLQIVKDAPWENPQYVTVMWCKEDDDGFTVAFQGEWPS